MRSLLAFGRFWYEFVIGDDWSIAAVVAATVAAAAWLAHAGVNAYWLFPVAVNAVLAASLWRSTKP